MTDIHVPDDYLDMKDGDHISRRSRHLRKQRLYGPFTSEECKLNCVVGLCAVFVVSVCLSIALVCLNVACTDNPCNTFCPDSYTVKTNNSDPCKLWTQKQEVSRPKRWSHDNSHLRDLNQDHNHPWMNNAWYRYVHACTHSGENHTGCYVCSHMPLTALHATLYGKPPTKEEALCIYEKAITGNCSTPGNPQTVIGGSMKDQNISNCMYQQYIVPMSDRFLIYNHSKKCSYKYPNLNHTCDSKFWVHLNVSHKTIKTFSVSIPPDTQHPICFNFTGEMGQSGISTKLKKLGQTRNCSTVLQAPDWTGNGSTKGTFWVQGTAWACGPKTYFMLPPNATGLCAPILVSDHTFKITTGAMRSRRKRDTDEVLPHDSIWGKDVPEEFKLWTDGQKVLHSLFPWIGVGKNMLRIETLDYRFGLFLNTSTNINKVQNEEIDAIRIVVMQHRVALDIILAERGGLCVLFNTTSCTYIPDNIHSQNMIDALNTLRNLRNAQQQDYVTVSEDWFTWLLSGSWKSLLIKGLVFLGILLLLLCVFTTCVIPCLKRMVSNMVSTSVYAYITLPQMEK